MSWNQLVIELSEGVATKENIDVFNMVFYLVLSSEHDSDMGAGQQVTTTVKVWDTELVVTYVAEAIDDEYPDETEPADIELVSVNGRTVENFLEVE